MMGDFFPPFHMLVCFCLFVFVMVVFFRFCFFFLTVQSQLKKQISIKTDRLHYCKYNFKAI